MLVLNTGNIRLKEKEDEFKVYKSLNILTEKNIPEDVSVFFK